jgi:6,7-dimethyl-8-ribityllumazine synthase
MKDPEPIDLPSAAGLSIGVVVSRYHREVTDRLEQAAVEAFLAAGGEAGRLRVVGSPGAFELVPIAAAMLRRPQVDAVVALGCIVRGETRHDRVLADAIATGLAGLAAELAKPAAFGVLTVEDLEQAAARSGGKVRRSARGGGHDGNKGREAMEAAIAAAVAIHSLQSEVARA